MAIGSGPMGIIAKAFLGSIENKDRRVAMSSVHLMSGLVSVIAPLIGGLIAYFIRWQFVFIVCAILGVVILYRIRVFQKNNNKHEAENVDPFMGYITILSNKMFFYFVA